MAEVFEAKLRRVGNSLGIIIPNELIQEFGFDDGDIIRVAIPSSDISARRGKKPFKRDKGDRF
jgi:antitoxin component of MazEF toxin-antitoxin module